MIQNVLAKQQFTQEKREETLSMDFSRLEKLVETLGGELELVLEDGEPGVFQMRFRAVPSILEQVETLLSLSSVSPLCPSDVSSGNDKKINNVLDGIKEFLAALTSANLIQAQEILVNLAESQREGLYREIGSLARNLHDSLKDIVTNVDPMLREIVEDRIPDSGNRLEHVLELTEKSANLTIDYIERMQIRNEEDQKKLCAVSDVLKAVEADDKTRTQIEQTLRLFKELQASAEQTHQDLITVLTAQDYQDLTGQIILKISRLLSDLESRLLNLISSFGARGEKQKEMKTSSRPEELYGPAHKEMADALHSQDDVDALLADFGF